MPDNKFKDKITAKGFEITVVSAGDENDYISLTDIARFKNQESPADVVKNWFRLRHTIEYLGLWEQLHNPDFKLVEFDQFEREAGKNAFTLSPQQWVEKTSAIGIISKSGRGGGTYAHRDIAFKFAAWISAEFE
ncbi:MAG: KilA-N domain-containing protein, partial [Oscillospiraceae bacterium]|nr:KilA-N domain-containing protein [Oscillospiraceae bacterium]